jgi:hypothetical protein
MQEASRRPAGGPPSPFVILAQRLGLCFAGDSIRRVLILDNSTDDLLESDALALWHGSQTCFDMETKDPMSQLAETTALLSLLKANPEKPKPNTQNIRRLSECSRQLSFDQEREICTSLAFLAGISDEPNHVMAVAVEEAQNPLGMQIRLSINKSKPTDGDKILEEVAKGFRRIFHILSRVANG